MVARHWIRFLLLATVALAAACGDPCSDLAHQICKCKATEVEQQACIEQVDADGNQATEAQQNACAELADSCSCDALAEGDLASCGLAEEGNASTQAAPDLRSLLPPVE